MAAALVGAFLAGLLSFLSPCVLPLTPVYIAQLVGPGLWPTDDPQARASAPRTRWRTATHAAAFVAGFGLAFVALGATASALGSLLAGQAVPLREVGGAALVLLGAHVAGLLPLPRLDRERRFSLRAGRAGYAISFAIGLIFAIGWTPCVGPVLAGVLLLAAQAATLRSGVLLLAVYALGLGVPFLALGLAFDRLAPWLKRLRPHLRIVEVTTGALLALFGVAIYFNWLLLVSARFGLPLLVG